MIRRGLRHLHFGCGGKLASSLHRPERHPGAQPTDARESPLKPARGERCRTGKGGRQR